MNDKGDKVSSTKHNYDREDYTDFNNIRNKLTESSTPWDNNLKYTIFEVEENSNELIEAWHNNNNLLENKYININIIFNIENRGFLS